MVWKLHASERNQSLQRQLNESSAREVRAYRRAKMEVGLGVMGIWEVYQAAFRLRLPESVLSYDFTSLPPNQPGEGLLRSALFSDGILLNGMTRGGLEDRMHRLVVTGPHDARYVRYPVNEDPQVLPSQPVDQGGMAEIAKDPVSVVSIASLAGALSIEAECGWQHIYRQPEIEAFRVPHSLETPL